MSKARDIAEKRLALGEIGEDEFDKIVANLTAANRQLDINQREQDRLQRPRPRPIHQNHEARVVYTEAPTESIFTKVFLLIGAVAIVFFAIVYFAKDSTIGGLETANIIEHGNKITFDISNTSSKVGDVLVYAKTKIGSKRCVHLFEMRPGKINNVSLPCSTVGNDQQVFVYTIWADSGIEEGMVTLAERIPVNW